ncbi:hypothetical protein HDF26_002298 [Pedobacter cryoconitis]|uniref:hypothetical protein n=1 Tax=Pedobacter cryoconitis TaxID=188932 RepID=UPI00160B0A9B|nr:hypothetical protein [Pedobacter cryoconitis]MBB6271841.1 hypothetical protein [Pedobacter cryoconitis]
MSKASTEPICENCGKPLFGRADKRFCNDSCRNNFNRIKHNQQKDRGQLPNPEIFQIIKHNYEILSSYKSLKLDEGIIQFVERDELIRKGYHFKFFTSIYQDNDGRIWKYCLDYGINEDQQIPGLIRCAISYRPEQLNTCQGGDTLIIKIAESN